jgi:hypothetical protein
MLSDLFAWISNSALGAWVVSSGYIWPTLESIHFVSLCVLFGSILVVDLRLIGFYRNACAPMVDVLIRLSMAAFAVNLATGILFFAGNTYKYVDNAAFELKLLLILAAGINAWLYRSRLSGIVRTEAVSLGTIAVGSLSILFWTGVIICGRMITFYAP